ncbi:MAG: gamma-glutamyl-gamma-aminobutyrate hydrolase family protein [Phycisphaerales bacterium]|nr:gamma-glutamyl-gamma-aminobutyrate hydrolase family protein [Phycisphaerales bacterium]
MSVTHPRIGITLEARALGDARMMMEMPWDYAKAVVKAGGMPLMLPWTRDNGLRREMIELIDGLLIPGGDDLDPKLYGQEPHPMTKQTGADRVAFDLAMLSLAEARQMPTLGICLGCQIMNVHRHGTLHQHLPEVARRGGETSITLTHSKPGDRLNAHEVILQRGTKLAAVMGLEQLSANSRHHQGIAQLGHGLVAAAQASDGLIEGIEDPTLPFWMAVQWHPENLADTVHERLFEALVKAAEKHRGA